MAVVFIAQLFLGAVFLISAVPKLMNPRLFIFNVQKYKLLPGPVAEAFGWALPYTELAIGLALTFGVQTRPAAILALAMLAAFVAAMLTAIAQGRDIDCPCFGLLYRERVGWKTVSRDIVFAMLAALVWLLPGRSPLADALRPEAAPLTFAALALAIATIAASIILGYKSRTVIRR